MHMTDSHHHPLLTIEDNSLKYGDTWSVDLFDISVIGEFTTPTGPASPDYFIAFIDRKGRRHEAPADALSRPLVDHLRSTFGPFEFGLANETSLKSRVMWPPTLADDELYVFTPMRPRSLGDRVRHLFGAQTLDVSLTDDVKAAMNGRRPPTKVPETAYVAVAARR